MATWPSGTKASTANLDAGTDKPSLARADIKQNVDNVNSIIDMFNITSPTDGQILKYNTSNTRFELATDSTGAGGITSVTAGTGISVDQTSEGGVTVTNTAPATGNELENVVEDTTPQLGGDLDVQTYKLVSTSNGNIELAPNGTGDVYLTTDTVRIGDSNADATITTNGTGDLILNTNAGTNSGSITIADGTNGDITIVVNGTGTINFSDDVVRALTLKDYAESVYSLGTTSGTITPDVANGNVQTITLNGNLTFSAFSNAVAGQSLTLIIDTDGTGRTLTSTMKFAGAEKTLSTTDTFDIISVFYDGTNYFASLSKGFA